MEFNALFYAPHRPPWPQDRPGGPRAPGPWARRGSSGRLRHSMQPQGVGPTVGSGRPLRPNPLPQTTESPVWQRARTEGPWSYGRGGPEDPPGPWARRGSSGQGWDLRWAANHGLQVLGPTALEGAILGERAYSSGKGSPYSSL